jgi:hypothetical protein
MERFRLIYFFVLALITCFHVHDATVHNLSSEDTFAIGEATLKGISVSKRISHLYALIFFGGIVLSGLYFLFRKRVIEFTETDKKLILLGLLAGVFAFLQKELIEIAHWTALLVGINIVLHKLKKAALNELDLINTTAIFIGHYQLFHSALIGGIIAFMTIWMSKIPDLSKFTWKIPVVASIPLLFTLAIEVSFIAGSHGIALPYLLVVAILSALVIWIVKRNQKDPWGLITTFTIPLAISGIAIMHIYHPIIDQPLELFEYANKLNPIMRWQFHEIPFIDHISSHLVSDYFWTSLYSGLHGYTPSAALLIYDNFAFVLGMISLYFLLRQLVPNSKTSLWILLLSPGLFFLIPPYYALVCWPIGLFIRLFSDQSKKNTRWFYFAVVILTLWRLDIGVSLIVASFVGLIFLAVKSPIWIKTGLIQLMLIGAPILLLALVFALQFPENFQQIIGYFGANQAHGFSVMALNESNLYWIDYFALPLLISGILVLHALNSWKKWNSIQAYMFIAGAFYLFNLQRGMVRHSFVEGYDTQILSIGWSVLIAQLYLLLQQRRERKIDLIVLGSTFFIPFVFSIAPGSQQKSVFQLQSGFSLKDISLSGLRNIDRVNRVSEFDQNVKPLISFLRENLGKQESFLDFSNSPMLYFYTERTVPSYFNQYLQNTVTNKLQRINLKKLRRNKPKYVIFSQVPEGFFDNSDGIPNKVRYHLISSFIFNNYQPSDTIGKFRVWQLKTKFTTRTRTPKEQWNLGMIPFYWKPEKSEAWKLSKNSATAFNNQIRLHKALAPGSFLRLKITSSSDQVVTLSKIGFSVSFDVKQGTHYYHIPLGSSENCIYVNDPLQLQTQQETAIQTIQIVSLVVK